MPTKRGMKIDIAIKITEIVLSGERQDGQIIYRAVAKEEPAGKPLKECRLVSVRITLFARGDS